LLVNPYDVEECAAALYRGLTMSETEIQGRMSRMRATVADRNVYAWAGSFLAEIHRIAQLKSGVAAGVGTSPK
jgi:trehalose 6-phosphate synthase